MEIVQFHLLYVLKQHVEHVPIYTKQSTVVVGSKVGSSKRRERNAYDIEVRKVSKTKNNSRH